MATAKGWQAEEITHQVEAKRGSCRQAEGTEHARRRTEASANLGNARRQRRYCAFRTARKRTSCQRGGGAEAAGIAEVAYSFLLAKRLVRGKSAARR